MATTTPNYGWTVPTSTDLVKDGATAIETLGDAIDASMNTALGTKKAGMVLLNTTSFSGVASQSFEFFTSTYSAYRIILSVTPATANSALYYRFVNGGVDRTTQYYGSALKVTSAASGSYIAHDNQAQGTITNNLYYQVRSNFNFDVFGVNSETNTPPTIAGTGLDTAVNGLITFASQRNATETNTGIKFYLASGNISGTCSIYGYNK